MDTSTDIRNAILAGARTIVATLPRDHMIAVAMRASRIRASRLASTGSRSLALVLATDSARLASDDRILDLATSGIASYLHNGKQATAARLTKIVRNESAIDGKPQIAYRYCDRPEVTGAITRLSGIVRPGSGSTLSRAQAQVRAAQDKAAADADTHRKATKHACDTVNAAVRAFRGATNTAARDRARSTIRSLSRRNDATINAALAAAGWKP